LEQFTTWFVAETWNVETEAGQNTTHYAHKIDNLLIRHSEDFIRTFELKDQLKSMLPTDEREKLDNT